jgi:hypothetical protein
MAQFRVHVEGEATMREIIKRSHFVWLAAGVAVGVAVMFAVQTQVPSQPVHAFGTHGNDNGAALVTVPLDESLEGVFFLDPVTGFLSGAAVSTSSRKFTTFYRHNVSKDFKVDGKPVKDPQFLIVSGVATLTNRGGGRGSQVASSIIYIAEVKTGQIAAYGVQWEKNYKTSTTRKPRLIGMLDQGKFRQGELEE